MTFIACEQLSLASAEADYFCGRRGLHALASEVLRNTMSRHCALFSIMLEEGAIATSCKRALHQEHDVKALHTRLVCAGGEGKLKHPACAWA